MNFLRWLLKYKQPRHRFDNYKTYLPNGWIPVLSKNEIFENESVTFNLFKYKFVAYFNSDKYFVTRSYCPDCGSRISKRNSELTCDYSCKIKISSEPSILNLEKFQYEKTSKNSVFDLFMTNLIKDYENFSNFHLNRFNEFLEYKALDQYRSKIIDGHIFLWNNSLNEPPKWNINDEEIFKKDFAFRGKFHFDINSDLKV